MGQIRALLQGQARQRGGPGDSKAARGRRNRQRSCRWSRRLARVGEPPQKEHAPGSGITDQKQERMIGSEDWRSTFADGSDPDHANRCGSRFCACLVHLSPGFVEEVGKVEVLSPIYPGEVRQARPLHIRHTHCLPKSEATCSWSVPKPRTWDICSSVLPFAPAYSIARQVEML